jgi:autotransporter-associated beta strand protein
MVWVAWFPFGDVLAQTWDGGAGNGNWGAGVNWNPNGVPAAGASVTFANTFGTGGRIIDLQNNRIVNVFNITTNAGGALTFNSAGNVLTLNGGLNKAANSVLATFNVDILMNSASQTWNGGSGGFTVNGAITGNRNLTIDGSAGGTNTFGGTAANAFNSVTVNSGILALNKTAGVDALSGTITVGDGGTSVEQIRLLNNNQIANGSSVTVGNTGVLDINGFSETINGLTGFATGAGPGGGAASIVAIGSGSLTVGSANASATYNGTISGTGTFTKTGTGTETLGGAQANTFSGTLVVQNGTLTLNKTAGTNAIAGGTIQVTGGTLLLGAANQIANSTAMTLGGGEFDTGGFSETLGNLTLSASSTIDFGSGASVLTYAGATAGWAGTLAITNWSGNPSGGGIDRLVFSSTTNVTGQLGNIVFVNPAGFAPGTYGARLIGNEVVPVPEPAAVGAAAALLMMAAFQIFRRIASGSRCRASVT